MEPRLPEPKSPENQNSRRGIAIGVAAVGLLFSDMATGWHVIDTAGKALNYVFFKIQDVS